MVGPAALHRYQFADYLALEESSNTKHEYLNGEVYAMAGGTPEHAALSAAISGALLSHLRGGPCRVYSSDLRVRVLATGLATYPDVTVVCGPLERDPAGPQTVVSPQVVVEVLSESTEGYDRGEKLDHYRTIPSLGAIVLVSHREACIEVWERGAGLEWSSHTFRSGEIFTLTSTNTRLAVDEIYAAAREPGV